MFEIIAQTVWLMLAILGMISVVRAFYMYRRGELFAPVSQVAVVPARTIEEEEQLVIEGNITLTQHLPELCVVRQHQEFNSN